MRTEHFSNKFAEDELPYFIQDEAVLNFLDPDTSFCIECQKKKNETVLIQYKGEEEYYCLSCFKTHAEKTHHITFCCLVAIISPEVCSLKKERCRDYYCHTHIIEHWRRRHFVSLPILLQEKYQWEPDRNQNADFEVMRPVIKTLLLVNQRKTNERLPFIPEPIVLEIIRMMVRNWY